ncbi:MAG: hypothetical protein IPO65_03800 [Saprospiraceae bacterium]|nr:hypothetical protein [Saprospiraceae bacterium]
MSTKTTIYLSDLHFEHQQWLKELVFWEDEIALYNKGSKKSLADTPMFRSKLRWNIFRINSFAMMK